jgi:large conductance mechanosensitive channel
MQTNKDTNQSQGVPSKVAKRKSIKFLVEFRTFLLRGNVVDLAIAVVIGAAFGAVVSGLVEDLITPLIAAIGGNPDFSNLSFTIHGSVFKYGHFINQIISFILVAAVVFFLVVRPLNSVIRKHAAEVAIRNCPECLAEIPAMAKRCRYCSSAIEPAIKK